MKYLSKNNLAACMILASCFFSSCEKETALDSLINDTVTENGIGSVKDGYFTATLMPGIGNFPQTRAAISRYDDRIQTLRFLLFKKGDDGVYTRYTDLKDNSGNPVDETVIKFESTNMNQSYGWPLTNSLQLYLPVGDYKIVFLGNMANEQFAEQGTDEIVQLNSGRFEDVRINMPNGGPLAFLPKLNSGSGNYQNLFYMATADFNQVNPNPNILLQRLVTQSTFSRDLIDTNDAVGQLVQSIVDQVNNEQLLEDLVEGILRNELTGALTGKLVGVTDILLGDIVDALVNVLLGDILTLVNDALLQQVTDLVNTSLHASDSNSPLNALLNPWSELENVAAYMDVVTSIDLNRVARRVETKTINNVPLIKSAEGSPCFTVTLLNGAFRLNSARVTDDGQTLLRDALGALDNSALAGLFVNLCTPFSYETDNNKQYTTNYDLLRLKLVDDTYSEKKPISVDTNDLATIVNVDGLTEALLGHGILGSLVGIAIEDIVQPVVDALLSSEGSLLGTGIYIKLPNLALGNITLEGRWGPTEVSDGTIAVSQIGEHDEDAAWKPYPASGTAYDIAN